MSFVSLINKTLLVCFSCFSYVHASNSDLLKISKTEDLAKEVLAYSKQENALIIFDLDYVILAPKDKVLRPCGEKNNLRKTEIDRLKTMTMGKKHLHLIEGVEVPKFDYLMGIIINSIDSEIVDFKLIDLIQTLTKNDTSTIILSHNRSGRIGSIKSFIEKKSNELKTLGVHLNYHIFDQNKTIKPIENDSPRFYCGLLFTDGATKGQTLKSFLQIQNYQPELIVFIDDREKMLTSVAETCKELNISFKGIHYTHLTDQEEVADPKISHFQFNYLLENEIWLNDTDALRQLNQ